MNIKKKEEQNMDTLFLPLWENKKPMGGDRDNLWIRDLKEDHLETAPPGDPSHIGSPNPYMIVYANKHLLTGT